MKLRTIILTISLVFSFSSQLHAEDAPSTPIAPSLADPQEASAPEVLAPEFEFKGDDIGALQLQMAETSYKINASIENKIELISAIESAVAPYCMKGLHLNYTYNPNNSDEECNKRVQFALKYDSENPGALCAKDGLGSESCKEAYIKQKAEGFYDYSVLPESVARRFQLDIKLSESKFQNEVTELKSTLLNQTTDLVTSPKDADKKQVLRDTYSKILDRLCRIYKIAPLENNSISTPTPSPTKKADEPFAALLQKMSGTPEQDPSLDSPKNRVRLLPPNCDRYSREALEKFPDHERAICYRMGFFSPDCIIALKNSSFRNPSTTQTKKKGSSSKKSSHGDFESF